LAEKAGLFLRLILLHMQLLEFPFQTQHLWEDRIYMNHARWFTKVGARHFTGICTIIHLP